jgi:hypothetical protein
MAVDAEPADDNPRPVARGRSRRVHADDDALQLGVLLDPVLVDSA